MKIPEKRTMSEEELLDFFNRDKEPPEVDTSSYEDERGPGAGLDGLIRQAQKHWQEFRPKMYRQYEEAGILEEKLNEAAEKTFREQMALMDRGFYWHEAWEMVRERYILLPEEKDLYQEDEDWDDDED